MPPSELRIKGVPYRSFDEVEAAIRSLGAEVYLLPPESDEREELSRHIMELLDNLPEDRQQAMISLLDTSGSGDRETEAAALVPLPVVSATESTVTIDGIEYPICPMCTGVGYLEALPPQDPTAEQCPACLGFGRVYTGSRVQSKETRACPICGGDGFVTKRSDVPLPPPEVLAADTPEWPGALWNADKRRWDPPAEQDPPWSGATWNDLSGNWQ